MTFLIIEICHICTPKLKCKISFDNLIHIISNSSVVYNNIKMFYLLMNDCIFFQTTMTSGFFSCGCI